MAGGPQVSVQIVIRSLFTPAGPMHGSRLRACFCFPAAAAALLVLQAAASTRTQCRHVATMVTQLLRPGCMKFKPLYHSKARPKL
jgi:hypothetical protein